MDRTQREHERAASDGDLEAEARRLADRLRSGELLTTHIQLLAHLGHEPACTLLAVTLPLPPADPWEWVAGLFRWGMPVGGRAMIAVLRPLLVGYEADHPQDPTGKSLLSAAEAWCDCPCDEHGAHVMAALEDVPLFESVMSMAMGPFQLMSAAGQLISGVAPLEQRWAGFARSFAEGSELSLGAPHALVQRALIPWVLEGPPLPLPPGDAARLGKP